MDKYEWVERRTGLRLIKSRQNLVPNTHKCLIPVSAWAVKTRVRKPTSLAPSGMGWKSSSPSELPSKKAEKPSMLSCSHRHRKPCPHRTSILSSSQVCLLFYGTTVHAGQRYQQVRDETADATSIAGACWLTSQLPFLLPSPNSFCSR